MKKILLLSVFIVCAFRLCAQYKSEVAYIFDPYYYDFVYYQNSKYQPAKSSHVKEMTEALVNPRKEKVVQKYRYDSDGNLDEFVVYIRAFGKISREITYSAIGKKRMPNSISRNAKGKEVLRHIYIYNSDTLLTEHSELRKGRPYAKIVCSYDSTRLTESDYYNKDESQPVKKWVYEYYPDHSKKKSTLYKNGKIMYVWNYECREEGVLSQKHKDTTTVCKNTEVDKDGNRIVTIRQFNDKGKLYKVVYVYSKDNRIIESRQYDSKDVLRYKYTQSPDHGFSAIYRYDGHGYEVFRTEYRYNSKNKMTGMVSYRKQKQLISRTDYSYNDRDLIMTTKVTGRKGETISESQYTYNEADLLLSKKDVDKKGRTKKETKFSYLLY